MSSLVEKLILLGVGALLTGILVPIVKAYLDTASGARKQLLDAALARQAELIQAQISLLSDFSDHGWKLLFAAFKVSYAFSWEDGASQAAASTAYTPLSWELLATLRATISKSKRLISDIAYQELLNTYQWLLQVDDQLSILLEKEAPQREWETFHRQRFPEAAERMDKAITTLATQLRLSAPLSTPG